jgi:hypothetical protein
VAHFVKWRGPFLDEGSPAISKSVQTTEIGKALRFGIWGGSGLNIGPNDRSVAQLNERDSVEGSKSLNGVLNGNNIKWYELVGLKESNVMIEARNPADNAVWDYFQLAVKKSTAKVRGAVKGINYDYHVDSTGINENYNASIVLTLKVALIPVPGDKAVKDDSNVAFTTRWWSNAEWAKYVQKFISVVQANWSEKMWLASPTTINELQVPKKAGGKARAQLHCVLKVQHVQNAASAHHRIQVVKVGAADGLAFRSNSTRLDEKDLKTVPVAVSGFAKPFSTVVHEMGHTLGLHHSCETKTPATPYCLATDPDGNEVMAKGNEMKPTYATPWQNAAASWFNSDTHGHAFKPSDFTASLTRLAPASV